VNKVYDGTPYDDPEFNPVENIPSTDPGPLEKYLQQEEQGALVEEFNKLEQVEKIILLERIVAKRRWAYIVKHPLLIGRLGSDKESSQIKHAQRILARALQKLRDKLEKKGF